MTADSNQPEGWARTLRGGHRAKFHYFRPTRTGLVSLCYQHMQRLGFEPLDHMPLRAYCCKACRRYLLVPQEPR